MEKSDTQVLSPFKRLTVTKARQKADIFVFHDLILFVVFNPDIVRVRRLKRREKKKRETT